MPNEEMWYQGTYITNIEWLMIEKERIANLTSKKVIIKTNSEGNKAIFRERLMDNLSIETKDFLIKCIHRNPNSYSDVSLDIMIELNHMCREVNRVYEK